MYVSFAPAPRWRRYFSAGLLGGLLFFGVAVVPASAQKLSFASEEADEKAQKAYKAFLHKDYEEAAKLFEEALTLDRNYKPTTQDWRNEAIRQFQAEPRNTEAALNAVKEAIKLDEKSPEPYYLRAQMYEELNRPESAVADLIKALDLKPDHEAALAELWKLLAGKHRYSEAVTRFKDLALKTENKNAAILYCLGESYHGNGNDEDAGRVFAQLIELKPDELDYHEAYAAVLGTEAAIPIYERMIVEKPNRATKWELAELYLADRKDVPEETKKELRAKAIPLLREVIRAGGLETQDRAALADLLAKAGQYEEAAKQLEPPLKGLDPKSRNLLKITFDYGSMLIKAGKADQVLEQLYAAMKLWRETRPIRPMPVLFALGQAHHLAGNKGEAELYFREFKSGLEASGFPIDQETAEALSKIYLDDKKYNDAVEVLGAATREYDKNMKLRFRYVHALAGAKDWQLCIREASRLVDDKEFGTQARLLLAQAYLNNKQVDMAIEQLRKFEGTPAWNDDVAMELGKALLAGNRTDAALKYIEKAYQAKPGDEARKLDYAQVLVIVGRLDEARRLYEEVTAANDRSVPGWIGLGDLEMQAAKGLEGQERVNHLRKAVNDYKEAFGLQASEAVLAKQGQAERDLNQAEGDVRARNERLWTYLYTGGLILAAAIPVCLFWMISRRQWAMRCYRQVVDLERDIKGLIRARVHACWNNRWDELANEPFQGRVDYKYLKKKAAEKHAEDVLDVANFGHLVGIIDSGWETLGFDQLATPGTRTLTIAGLSYVGNCRNAIFHSLELQELQTHKEKRRQEKSGGVLAYAKWVLTGFGMLGSKGLGSHLNGQVKTSVKAIRKNFDLSQRTVSPAEESDSIAEVEAVFWNDSGRESGRDRRR